MKPFVTVNIDGIELKVAEGTTILDAAKLAGIHVPTLCHHPDLKVRATCRICLVQIRGSKRLSTACSSEVWDGMEVFTNTTIVREERRTALELILANHPQDCLSCIRNGSCELQKLTLDLGIRQISFPRTRESVEIDKNSSLVRNMNKCIQCGRCSEVCQHVQNVAAIGPVHRTVNYAMSTAFDMDLASTQCVLCGQCSIVCPVGAIYEQDDTQRVWQALNDQAVHVVVQVAPAVRVSIGEEFGMEPGSVATGQLVKALRILSFDKVFDTDFAADVTILEEGQELIERLQKKEDLPMMTSCSPGWINYMENFQPDLLPHLSTCKSPQQIFGALAKSYYADKMGVDAGKIFVVSIMPCTAKKTEARRPGINSGANADIDAVLTTREFARMLRQAGIQLTQLSEAVFDSPLGISTGAGVIFGASGGVMEAALRTVYEIVSGLTLDQLDFTEVRGMDGIKEAAVSLGSNVINVAVVNGLANVKPVLEQIKAGKSPYHFIEVMCCPGGCVGGGGQPHGKVRQDVEMRAQALYNIDAGMPIRKSHENPAIQKMYNEYLNLPDISVHKLLHTSYHGRSF